MKKKVLSLVLASAMALSMVACGGGTTNTESTNTQGANTEATNTEATSEVDYGSGEIKIWVAEAVVSFTETKANEFLAANPAMSGYTVTVEPVGEGEAAGNMITDVQGGADIYGFAQDQIARLVAAGAIAPVLTYADEVTANNDEGSVKAGTVGDVLYAYPTTSDNGYFMYYDKSVVTTDITSLDAILKDCEAANKKCYIDLSSWYQTAFFFGAGCTLTFETDVDGNFTKMDTNYASAEGVKALKAMIAMHKSPAYVKGSSVSDAIDAAVVVSGTWDSAAAKEKFGDNYACAKLPKATVDGAQFQLGGFSGYKLMGVKPQEDSGKFAVCQALANYLTSEEVQLARYNEVGWGPSNKNAQAADAVKADVALTALGEQLQFCMPQGQYPGDYWSTADAIGASVDSGEFDNMSDEELMKVLEDFIATLQGTVAQ